MKEQTLKFRVKVEEIPDDPEKFNKFCEKYKITQFENSRRGWFGMISQSLWNTKYLIHFPVDYTPHPILLTEKQYQQIKENE